MITWYLPLGRSTLKDPLRIPSLAPQPKPRPGSYLMAPVAQVNPGMTGASTGPKSKARSPSKRALSVSRRLRPRLPKLRGFARERHGGVVHLGPVPLGLSIANLDQERERRIGGAVHLEPEAVVARPVLGPRDRNQGLGGQVISAAGGGAMGASAPTVSRATSSIQSQPPSQSPTERRKSSTGWPISKT